MNLRAILGAACLVGAVIAVVVGGSWSDRLSQHQGYYLVPVPDAVTPATRAALLPHLPRRTRLVVFDGLGFEEASRVPALLALRAHGQCLRTQVGSFSVSQPMYAVLSTGLEADRTGARNNEPPLGPVRAEPLWRVARQAGLTTSGISELSWWERIFPAGPEGPAAFGAYLVRPRAENYLATAPAADLMLIHPVYIDEAGHESGAASEAYRRAMARADAELAGLTASVDLTQELLVVTADHGHSLRGGHGGQQPRITQVLTCYAGKGVRRSDQIGALRSTTIAPSLALLQGLRFPTHMGAGPGPGDDDLDALWGLVDPAAWPASYLQERRQAVARFREANRAQLQRWPGGQTTWTGFYALHRQAQQRGGALVLLLAAAALLLLSSWPLRSTAAARRRDAAQCVAFVLFIYLAVYLLTIALRGSFDPTAINQREGFIRFGLALSAAVLGGAILLHHLLRRSVAALRADLLALLVVTAVLSLGHPAVLGWHLGFPIPAPALIYLPYFAALFQAVLCGLALLLCLV